MNKQDLILFIHFVTRLFLIISLVEQTNIFDLFDSDSLQDFSRFEEFTAEDWDRTDNERRYKKKMMKELCQQVGQELARDVAFRDQAMSQISAEHDPSGLKSDGNLTLTHLNLACE